MYIYSETSLRNTNKRHAYDSTCCGCLGGLVRGGFLLDFSVSIFVVRVMKRYIENYFFVYDARNMHKITTTETSGRTPVVAVAVTMMMMTTATTAHKKDETFKLCCAATPFRRKHIKQVQNVY